MTKPASIAFVLLCAAIGAPLPAAAQGAFDRARADIARFCNDAEDPDLCQIDQEAGLTRFLILMAGMQKRNIPIAPARKCMETAKSADLIDWAAAADCLAAELDISQSDKS